jgi:DNA-binding GntR family transcriptional regulator
MASASVLQLVPNALAGINHVENTTVAGRVYRELKDYLAAGQLMPGQKLTLRELAAALGVSPMPVREAVGRLTAEGALEVLPNRRIRVPSMAKARFSELLRIRIALEGLAAVEAVDKIRESDIDRMDELNRQFADEMGKPDADPVRLFRLNKDLHFILYEAADAPVLLSLIENMWLQVGPVLHLSLRRRVRGIASNPSHDLHKSLTRALRRRDHEGARKALAADLKRAATQILAEGDLPD